MGWTEIILGALTLLGGCAWVVNFRKDKQEARGIVADNRQKDMNRRTSERRDQAGLGFPEREGGNAKRNLSKMYVDELTSSSSFAPRPFERARWLSAWRRFNLNIVVPLQQRVQKLESQIERLNDAIEGINSCPYRAECPVLGRMRQQPEGD